MVCRTARPAPPVPGDIVLEDLEGADDQADDGVQVLREWRNETHDLPVMILTARAQVSDKVEGLNACLLYTSDAADE